jgi:hypothetical protein
VSTGVETGHSRTQVVTGECLLVWETEGTAITQVVCLGRRVSAGVGDRGTGYEVVTGWRTC